jgi:hypothetical protein
VKVSIPLDGRVGLAAFIEQRCTLVQVVTDDEDEAFRFFDSQNYRGKPLKPHDLAAQLLRDPAEDEASEYLPLAVGADGATGCRVLGLLEPRRPRWAFQA